jgi:hypothetical protein
MESEKVKSRKSTYKSEKYLWKSLLLYPEGAFCFKLTASQFNDLNCILIQAGEFVTPVYPPTILASFCY